MRRSAVFFLIKRSLFLDMNSISACTQEELDKYKKIELIKNYVETKQIDVKKYNESHDYGKLSGRKLEDLIEGSRTLSSQEEKKNSQDF